MSYYLCLGRETDHATSFNLTTTLITMAEFRGIPSYVKLHVRQSQPSTTVKVAQPFDAGLQLAGTYCNPGIRFNL